MIFDVYLYDRNESIVTALRDLGITHDTVVELTPDQVLSLTDKFAVMIKPITRFGREGRLLCIDDPRWSFRQR